MKMVEGEIINPTVKGFGVRHGQVLLHFFFYVIIYGIEFSLPSTIMAILEPTIEHSENFIYINWTGSMVSQVLGAYLYGFLVTELFGGWFCNRFGFKWPMVIMMVIISAITLNLPTIMEEYGFQGLMFCRIVQGLCSGLTFAMPADFVSKWIPSTERTTLGTAIYASGRLGEVLVIIGAPYLIDSKVGWPFVFTQYGYLAIIWAILMAIFGANSPEQYSRKISEGELNHIVQNRGNALPKPKVKIPWVRMFTSMPFWAIVFAEIGSSWLIFVMASSVRQYLHTDFDIGSENNFFSIGILISWILSFVVSGIAEALIKEGKTTIGQSRKIFNAIGCLIPSIFLIYFLLEPRGTEFEGISFWTVMYVATIGTICGSKLNANDITSNFAPIVFGIAAWIGMVFNIIMVAVLREHLFDNWPILFLFTAALQVVTNIFYLKFGSGEEQEWDAIHDDIDEDIDLSKSSAYVSCDEGKYLLFIRRQ